MACKIITWFHCPMDNYRSRGARTRCRSSQPASLGLLRTRFSRKTRWNSSEVSVLSRMSTSAWRERPNAHNRFARLGGRDPFPKRLQAGDYWYAPAGPSGSATVSTAAWPPDFAVKPAIPCTRAISVKSSTSSLAVFCALYTRSKCLFTGCVCSLEPYQSKSCLWIGDRSHPFGLNTCSV